LRARLSDQRPMWFTVYCTENPWRGGILCALKLLLWRNPYHKYASTVRCYFWLDAIDGSRLVRLTITRLGLKNTRRLLSTRHRPSLARWQANSRGKLAFASNRMDCEKYRPMKQAFRSFAELKLRANRSHRVSLGAFIYLLISDATPAQPVLCRRPTQRNTSTARLLLTWSILQLVSSFFAGAAKGG
jgi:hypothetical protein